MKTEKEISDKYKWLIGVRDRSGVDHKELAQQIATLLWILTCDTCKSYPCTCYDPF